MQRDLFQRSSSPSFLPMVALAAFFSCAIAVRAVMPFNSATVTRVENSVDYGQVHGGRSETRKANPQDVVKASDFLLSATDSRAELRYDDGTIVRIGQNTIFSWDANTRTLKLDKGTFVFYIPKGAGGGTIKTPSITAAITGTCGKVSENTIAIVEGEVTILPSGEKVGKYQFARRNPDGTLTIGDYDPAKAFEGKLMTFNGDIVKLTDLSIGETYIIPPPPDESQFIAHDLPGQIPPPVDRSKTKVSPPPPPPKNNTNTPY